MNLPRKIDYLKNVNDIKYDIGLRKEFIGMFNKALPNQDKEENIKELKNHIKKYEDEILILQERMGEILSKSTRKKYDFPVIDVPADGNPDWWEGAYTMCFVYSKHKGNFILRGWRREVMDYLKKNYTHYFCYVSMWHNGISRGHWKFWKESVTIYEPHKSMRQKEWKHRVIKYSGSGMFSCDKVKELHFKRLPKRWIKEFDEL